MVVVTITVAVKKMATGTTLTTYSNREFLFRLQILIIDGGTEVLRNIFDQRLQNHPLYVVLANEKTKVNQLRAQKTITQAQYDLLYPPGGQLPNCADFDITLIVCLLRNLKSLGVKQNYKWHVPPKPTDNSFEADLWRIKGYRNEIAHISSTKGFNQATFKAKWTEIEQVLLRLNSTVSNPLLNFNQTIDNYKRCPMDPSAEHRIQTIIEQWREMERGLESDIQIMKEDALETKKDVQNIKKDVADVTENINSIKQELQVPGRRGKSGILGSVSKLFGFGQKQLKKDLQDDLISFYKHKHTSIHLFPLMEEDQPLLKFYEMPDIQSVKVTRSWDGDRPEKTPVKTLNDMFYKENRLCSNIYLTADAGYGKTAFSKKLALAWCHAKKPDKKEEKHFSEHEITVMGGFSFVFVVLLRDSSSECDIDKLILNQICSQLAHIYTEENVTDILCKETCLVILDGLDEWTHPVNSCRRGESNIPHQRVRENVAVLTTTRPWKLSVSGLHSSQIDQKLELKGLSDDSAKKLKRSVISHLHRELDESEIEKYETEFSTTVQENHNSDLTAIPLFLMYFLFLWINKMNIGKSLADSYSSFIELLLSRTAKQETKTDTVQGNIPPCFNNNTLCKQFYTLLTALGKLAFYTLFSETKENTLVFDGCIAEKYLSKDELTFCLKTGIITQSKVQGATLLQQKTKVSFAHKTMQEFLAALYINSATNQKSVQEIILSKCTCVKDILDMSKMFMFMVSISGKFSFSRELMKITNEDEITQEYRRSLQIGLFSHPIKDLQNMYISCCKEIPNENEVSLCLQDVFIDKRCHQEEYREHLKGLITKNKHNIRSVSFKMEDMRRNTLYNTGRKVIDYFALGDLEKIEKIYYYNSMQFERIDAVSLSWLKSPVTSLCLRGHWRCSWSRSLFVEVKSLQELKAIGIHSFGMSHDELGLLYDFISQRDCLREIELGQLHCTSHFFSSCCTRLCVLLGHKRLIKLQLYSLQLSLVVINLVSLEYCELRVLPNIDLDLVFLNCADNKLNTFICVDIRSSVAIDRIVRVLMGSRHVRKVELVGIYLGDRDLTFSPDFVNIELLIFRNVSMEAESCRDLVNSVLELKQTVTVYMDNCTITSEEEFKTLKEVIKASQRVRRVRDVKDEFVFVTINDVD